ncbi:hypothetical protein [Chitinophaga sp. YIM B06452]|uniref:hypothetical protein n=1 Tax=Chitinophaga sp. YIM B06452 TaxID=3082158 RepID=UPI0031FECEB2
MNWTESILQGLIDCPKIVLDPPKDNPKGARSGFTKKTFTLKSCDGDHEFSCFITQSLFFPENFSIGLMYNSKEKGGSVVLLRCNGKHGGTREFPHHAHFHIHYSTAERINSGMKAEGEIRITEEYSSLDSALEYFVNLINLEKSEQPKILPSRKIQIDLFSEDVDR